MIVDTKWLYLWLRIELMLPMPGKHKNKQASKKHNSNNKNPTAEHLQNRKKINTWLSMVFCKVKIQTSRKWAVLWLLGFYDCAGLSFVKYRPRGPCSNVSVLRRGQAMDLYFRSSSLVQILKVPLDEEKLLLFWRLLQADTLTDMRVKAFPRG